MATYEFKLPDIGEGVMEGEIVKWLVSEGQSVTEDQPLVEVMTDKATVAIPSPKAGRVVKRHGKEGEIAKVHQPLVTIELDSAAAGARTGAEVTEANEGREPPGPRAAKASDNGGGRVLATPVTRRMAREHGINLAEVSGSGPQGRVTKADVMAAIGSGSGAVATGAVQPTARGVRAPAVPVEAAREDQRIPLKGLRRRIAEKMVRSKTSAPHFTFVEEMDATELVRTRGRLNAALAHSASPAKISFLPFVCKGLVAAFRQFPNLNANFDEARQELVVRGSYNFGIAVATDEGLTVPVLKDVDRLSIQQLASEIARLSAAAREKRLKLDELSGGTFTITSLGQSGGLLATPIINHPEVAILGVHRMRKRPVVRDDQIVVREMMYLSLSFDHRVIDGAMGADFTYALIRYLEHPELLFLELA
jgi:pyruvate dehydrogenase E2 component (dihydrolipoyllysine-residue acetyltransferase)